MTIVIAGVTVAISIILLMTGWVAYAAIGGGFIPASVTTTLTAPHGIPLLPFWVTPLTATLVHGGYLHLGLNMLMLVYCGRMLERAIGSVAMAVLYGVGAYVAAAGQWAFDPGLTAPMIGASGAGSAVIAAYAMLFSAKPVPAIGSIPSRVVRVAWLAAAWVGIQLLIGFAGETGQFSIAIGAHIGGFLAGLTLARPLLLWRYRHA